MAFDRPNWEEMEKSRADEKESPVLIGPVREGLSARVLVALEEVNKRVKEGLMSHRIAYDTTLILSDAVRPFITLDYQILLDTVVSGWHSNCKVIEAEKPKMREDLLEEEDSW